jgi:Xaa-Pro aminopeptidase
MLSDLAPTTLHARRKRLEHRLRAEGFDTFVSAAPADVRYFTGSEEANGTVLLTITGDCVLVLPAVSFVGAGDTCRDTRLVSLTLAEDQGAAITRELSSLAARRIVIGELPRSILVNADSHARFDSLAHRPGLGASIRRQKEPTEVALLTRAARIADEALRVALAAVAPGATELAVAADAEAAMKRAGAESTAFRTIVASGFRSAWPNGFASRKSIQPGDIGFIDIGPLVRGYHGDATRAFVVGTPSPEQRAMIDTVEEALARALGVIRPSVAAADVFGVIVDVIENRGYRGCFPHHGGHALGLFGAEPPWLEPGERDQLRAGDFMAVEPGVYVPGFGGVRLEEDVVVRAYGVDLLTTCPHIRIVSQ